MPDSYDIIDHSFDVVVLGTGEASHAAAVIWSDVASHSIEATK